MTREIKFRWYDRKCEEFVFFTLHDLINHENECNENGRVPDWVVTDEVEQYTGFRDKNGVEIYEGDIVKYRTYPNQIIDIKFEKGAFTAGEHNGSSTAQRPKLIVGRLMEVIGNVYQNPELLK